MRASEFINSLLKQAQQNEKSHVTINTGDINIHGVDEPVDKSKDQEQDQEVENPIDRDDVMIPPLQQKIEMMKKMSGVDPKNQELLATHDDEPLNN